LESTNRPYSTINVFDNLHGAVKKASLQRVLDKLGADGEINEKSCGKSKVYWALQDQHGEITSAMLTSLRAEVLALEAQASEAEGGKVALAAQVAEVQGEPSDEALESQLEAQEAEIAALQSRYDAIVAAADGVVVSAATKETLVSQGKAYRKRWSELRGKIMDVVARMSEGMDKSVPEVFALAGMERDEEYGANLKSTKF
jgi:26S proteasome regulatory subunit (ATPase 3-interacting protein)